MRRILPAVALFVTLAAPTSARAQPADAAAQGRARFEEGIERFNLGDLDGALAQFQRAYELTASPVVLYNIGLVQAKRGHPVEASDALRRVIASPGPLSAERVERARATEREQSAHIGELLVICSVAGAAIEVDGAEVAHTPLGSPLRLKEGTHRVALIADRYSPVRKDVLVAPGGRADVTFDLVPIDKRLAHVALRTRLPGAAVLLDGQAIAETPTQSTFAVVPGRHRVELRRFGYLPIGRDVVLDEGATADLEIEPEEDGAALRTHGGRLALDLSESGAVVMVNGRLRGAYAGALLLPPGRHHVHLERSGFFAEERDVDVSAGAATTVRIRFEPTAEYRVQYGDRARAFRRWGFVGVASGVALLGFGVGFTVWNTGKISEAHDAVDEFNKGAKPGSGGRCDAGGPDFPDHEQECSSRLLAVNDAIDTAKGRVWIGIVGVVVGAAASGLGITLLAMGDDPSRYEKTPSNERLGLRLRPDLALSRRGALLGLHAQF